MTYADDLRDLACYNTDKESYFKVRKYYESIRSKMKDEAINGYLSMWADAKDIAEDLRGLTLIKHFAKIDGIKVEYMDESNEFLFKWLD